ncbi:MAG: hypothetical protein HZA31_05460 [Opitutae bacterium]|nr:hypothetical protein [Opitutae bacterium]
MPKTPFYLAVLLSFAALAHGSEKSDYKVESRMTHEFFTSKVVKVLSFSEGSAEYQAYVVTWKDHEVVVAAPFNGLASKTYKVGDTVRCVMRQQSLPARDKANDRLFFEVAPDYSADLNPAKEAARLEQFADEVRRRRNLRETKAPLAESAEAKP